MEVPMLDKSRPKRKVRVFKNGRSRAIRIPKEFDFGGDEMIIQQEKDGKLTLEPVRKKRSLLEILANLEPLPKEDWLPKIEDFPPEPVDLGWVEEE
jgi:antitoxin VapB